jgi:hypothetical protein
MNQKPNFMNEINYLKNIELEYSCYKKIVIK